jgi:hypothetical protein
MMDATVNPGTHWVAPFALDGELLGVELVRADALSPKWLDVCRHFLDAHGPVFRASFGQMLQHLELKLTSQAGHGLGTWYANQQIVVSTAYLNGRDHRAEMDMLAMFVDSLRRNDAVQQAKATPQPFAQMATPDQRPLHVVVVWANPAVSDQDTELVRELSTHFAAAFFHYYEK